MDSSMLLQGSDAHCLCPQLVVKNSGQLVTPDIEACTSVVLPMRTQAGKQGPVTQSTAITTVPGTEVSRLVV